VVLDAALRPAEADYLSAEFAEYCRSFRRLLEAKDF